MPDRLICEVPGCRHTTKRRPVDGEDARWVCAKHWAVTDKRRRLLLARARRRGRVGVATYLWWKLRAEAIERAMGI